MNEEVGVGGCAVKVVGFRQNIGDSLIGCGEVLGRFGFGKGVQRTHAQIDVKQVGRARRQRCTDHRDINPVVVVPVTQPLSDVMRHHVGGVGR